MLKKLKKISGTVTLSKENQKAVNGGICAFIMCSEETEGCLCYDTVDFREGICYQGFCY